MIAGLVGGLIAAGAMSVVHGGLARITAPTAPTHEAQGDDATVKVAASVMRRVLRRPLPDDRKPLAGHVVHYTFGGVVGAIYGGVASLAPRVTTALGLPFGVAVWLGAHVIMVPSLGLAPPVTRQPPSREGIEFFLHLVYGAVTEIVRRLLRRGS